MREAETTLQQFGEFLLRTQLARPRAAPYFVRWVRQFLARPAANEPLADRVRCFCEDRERDGREDWQVRQAEHALKSYFVSFLQRTDWRSAPAGSTVSDQGRVDPLAALEQLRLRLRTRHYSNRTESTCVEWVRRFFSYLLTQQSDPQPSVDEAGVRSYLTYLATRRHVSASTQDQALSAMIDTHVVRDLRNPARSPST